MKTLSLTALIAALSTGSAMAQADVKPDIYPQTGSGQAQHIFILPPQNDESLVKLEIIAGLEMEVDCNHVMIAAQLHKADVQGWGYPYYEIRNISQPASTMMGCPDQTKTNKIVTLNLGPNAFERYNSKLPLVVYAPENLKLGYRIWKSDGAIHYK